MLARGQRNLTARFASSGSGNKRMRCVSTSQETDNRPFKFAAPQQADNVAFFSVGCVGVATMQRALWQIAGNFPAMSEVANVPLYLLRGREHIMFLKKVTSFAEDPMALWRNSRSHVVNVSSIMTPRFVFLAYRLFITVCLR